MMDIIKIICISNVSWDVPLWTNSQEVMSRLSEKHRVLFVENQRSIFAFIKNPSIIKRLVKPLRKIGENLLIYYPASGLPFSGKFYWINYINKFIQRFFLRRVINKYDLFNAILWIYLPSGSLLIDKLEERLVCYDCIDEYSAYPGVNKKVYLRLEENILDKADLVFTSSRILFSEKQKRNPNTYYTPNPCDFSLFVEANREDLNIPIDIKDLSRPIIGFFGEINYKIDIQLIKHVAISKPSWSIVLIGPVVGISISELKRMNNISFLGYKQKNKLPFYLKFFDVCIIPYVLNDYTKRISPLKIYEYFASGKPVVSTNIPECRNFEGLIRIAKDKNEFIYQIERALNGDDRSMAEEKILLAKQNTWGKKIEKLLLLIKERMKDK